MNASVKHGVATFEADDEPRWALVQRVAGSHLFVKAQQLRDILLFVCQKALADPDAVIREYEIACTVLGRKADFNSHDDNIVRVQISHLRKKLEAYFANEGHDEPFRIVIPRGSYVPRFEAQLALPAALPLPAAEHGEIAAVPTRQGSSTRWRWGTALAALCVVLVCADLWQRNRAWPAATTRGTNPVWDKMFAADPVSVVVADTCLVLLQDILDVDIPLTDYVNGHYPHNLLDRAKSPELRQTLELISTRQYSSLADTNTASKLLQLGQTFGEKRATIRYARYLSVRDFQTGNFVLMGSRRGIPWVQLFEPQLNFAMEENQATRTYAFRNKRPSAHEETLYAPSKKDDGTVETYADIAFVPNLGGTGSVLILNGIGMEGAEAAGDLVAGSRFAQILSSFLPKQVKGGTVPYFEILLRIRAVAGASRSSEVVTYRILASQ